MVCIHNHDRMSTYDTRSSVGDESTMYVIHAYVVSPKMDQVCTANELVDCIA